MSLFYQNKKDEMNGRAIDFSQEKKETESPCYQVLFLFRT